MVGVTSSKGRMKEENKRNNGERRGKHIFFRRLSQSGELLHDMRGGCPILWRSGGTDE